MTKYWCDRCKKEVDKLCNWTVNYNAPGHFSGGFGGQVCDDCVKALSADIHAVLLANGQHSPCPDCPNWKEWYANRKAAEPEPRPLAGEEKL